MFSDILTCVWEFLSYGNSARLGLFMGFSELQTEFDKGVIICSIIIYFTMHTVTRRVELEPHLHKSQISPQKQWNAILSTSRNCPTTRWDSSSEQGIIFMHCNRNKECFVRDKMQKLTKILPKVLCWEK